MKLNKRFVLVFLLITIFHLFTSSYLEVVSNPNELLVDVIEAEPDFSDRRVLVVLDKEASFDFNSHSSVDDFPEIECLTVTNITPMTEIRAKESVKKGNGTNISYNRILCLELKNPGKDNVLAAISKLKNQNHILYAEPDYDIFPCDTTPNDSFYDHQWGHEKIDLPSAWDEETGSQSVYVGVVDSGIERTHPEFSGRIKTDWCMSFLSGTGVAEPDPTDGYGHGTHVAGIIGAAGNNGSGVCGVCWNVKLVSLKIYQNGGASRSSNMISAIDYAESKSIPILNISYTTGNSSSLRTAIENYSGLVVCAAGNDGVNIDNNPVYPACYTCSNIITVGKSDINDNKANTSNYGVSSVDIFAPGQGILSTYPLSICSLEDCDDDTHYADGYHILNGTSMAAP
ncbi:MAG: S8 family serine peptidase, partial [Clostridia bacterium]|nr:S8 family serine peptidase [Clostridia bacterium]